MTRHHNSRTVAASVDEYINGFPAEVQVRLRAVRAAIRAAAPAAVEGISYAMPAYKLHGPLIYFAGYQKHIGVYPVIGACRVAFADELAGFAGGKGTVQLPHDSSLPLDLIAHIVSFRATENTRKAEAKRKPAKSHPGRRS